MLEVTNANWEQNWDLNPDPIGTLHFDPGLFMTLEKAGAGARSPVSASGPCWLPGGSFYFICGSCSRCQRGGWPTLPHDKARGKKLE